MQKRLPIAFLALSLVFSTSAMNWSYSKINVKKVGFGALVTAFCAYLAYKGIHVLAHHPSRLKWDGEKIHIKPKDLASKISNEKIEDTQREPFLWGVATSAYQVEGEDGAEVLPYNQWHRCEGKEISIEGQKLKPVPFKSDIACEHWKRYKQDIDLLKKLGFNSCRISISWGKVEPKEGIFSVEALGHYEHVCQYMIKNGIKPVVTLHHYTHPCWFEDKGAFEKEENIAYFVRFCQKVFVRLKKYVHLWFTFNTFVGYAMAGYSQAIKPPFKKDMVLAIKVLKHLLESHVRVYYKLKSIDKNAQIGIYKNIFQLDPWNLLNPLDIFYSYMGDYISNTSIYNFFKRGVFKIWIPGKVSMLYKNKSAIGALDCIGLNYYSAGYIKNFKVVCRPGAIPTENPRYTIYPEGFYRALMDISSQLAKPLEKIKKKKVPIYVTENGIAACKDSERSLFYKRYLYALSKAIQEGVCVKGYITWSLIDNYEWSYGYTVRYGICEVDRKTQERKLKNGTEFLLGVVNNK